MSNGFILQVSIKKSNGTLINITGDDSLALQKNLQGVQELAALIAATEDALFGNTPKLPISHPDAVPPPEAPDVAAVRAAFATPAGAGEVDKIVADVTSKPGPKPGMTKHYVRFQDGTEASTISDKLGNLAGGLKGRRALVTLEATKWGPNLKGIRAV